jgi:hypothetical protein
MDESQVRRIARAFTRLGWTGVWIQAALAILPAVMIAYALLGRMTFVGGATGSRASLGFLDSLAICGLAILAFTTFWSYRYACLGKRIAMPGQRPAWSRVIHTLWVGLWASCAGIALSLLLMIVEVLRLLVLLLKAPQGGVPVMRTDIDSRMSWVSAIDVVTLLAELCTLTGELVVLGFTLWLLFSVTRHGKLHDAASPPAGGFSAPS